MRAKPPALQLSETVLEGGATTSNTRWRQEPAQLLRSRRHRR